MVSVSMGICTLYPSPFFPTRHHNLLPRRLSAVATTLTGLSGREESRDNNERWHQREHYIGQHPERDPDAGLVHPPGDHVGEEDGDELGEEGCEGLFEGDEVSEAGEVVCIFETG